MIRFTERVNLAVHALGYMAACEDELPLTVAGLARALGVSAAHLAKVMRALVEAGFVASLRGAGGGYGFARDPGGITFLSVIEAIDGPLDEPGCLLGRPVCQPGSCLFSGLNCRLASLLREELGTRTLREFNVRGKPEHDTVRQSAAG